MCMMQVRMQISDASTHITDSNDNASKAMIHTHTHYRRQCWENTRVWCHRNDIFAFPDRNVRFQLWGVPQSPLQCLPQWPPVSVCVPEHANHELIRHGTPRKSTMASDRDAKQS